MRFCFFSGYRDLKGGYTTLLLTLIKELYRQEQEVILLNFKQGLIADELEKENIRINIIDIEEVDWDQINRKIFSTDIFIITKFMEQYRYLLKINPRVIYYDINDFICQISDYKFGIKFPDLGKKLVNEMLHKKSLLFMDDTGVFNLKQYFSLEVTDPVFLPIPVSVPAENNYLRKLKVDDSILRLTYIGRSVDWKMMPLKKVLEDCAASGIQKKIIFSIVVDSLSDFRKFINTDDYKNVSGLEIHVTENMPPSLINDFLLRTSDLHFAMGTAALDAAKLGVPTILVDYSINAFPASYTYKWLYETTGFSLGRNLDKMASGKGITMKALLYIIVEDNRKLEDFSRRSFEYVTNNHSVSKIATRLTLISRQAEFRMNDARHLIPFYFKPHTLLKKASGFFGKRKKA